MASLALTAAGVAAGSAYLNARLSLSHDLLFARIAGSSVINIIKAVRSGKINFFYVLEKQALDTSSANRPFMLFEGRSWTYKETYDNVLQWGTWLREVKGVKKGDVVVLNYQNSAMFMILWFSIWTVGAKPAFINYNLRDQALTHCLKESTARLALVDPHVADALTDDVREKMAGMEFIVTGDDVQREVQRVRGTRGDDELRKEDDYVAMAILIYTSGTTGMPKPAVVSWAKIFTAIGLCSKGTGMKKDDVFYTCMPLYHSSASCLGVCSVLFTGATLSIGRKFSTKTFWKEVRDTKSTIIQYVGETCRYLTVAPPEIDPVTGENLDKKHHVRVAFGNGLRPDVWDKFKERFAIDTIYEFYAATEGALGLWNLSRNAFGKGAIGRYGALSTLFLGLRSAIVKIDDETEEPWRDPQTGFCQRVKSGDVGEFLVSLPADDVNKRFQGYFGNQKATNSKIMRDVFKKGDAWFRSGDVLRWDSDGMIFFSDRIGDTFRWKSENVSTAEVSQAMGLHPNVLESNVYGVQLPNHDGRAGCAAIAFDSPNPSRELMASLAKHAREKLPRYAVPLFLRVVKGVGEQTTGTNKQQKHHLRQQSVNPSKVQGDALFWLKGDTYEPFGETQWKELEGGRVKL
ncbi:Putative fatty acid transporter protein [Podospora comata]|uniref:Fatty acid transporter protein n=1 Tax=Podospora comata TaxID=48703 RepID=A0ABY6S4I5_PODCO|nr:Putative fatty acid transporter protein [Podospora comata]